MKAAALSTFVAAALVASVAVAVAGETISGATPGPGPWKPVAGLRFECSKYARVEGDRVIVDVPKDLPGNPGNQWAHAVLDLTEYDGQGFGFEVDALDADVTDAHGIKFMVAFRDHLWGNQWWLEPVRSETVFAKKRYDINAATGMLRGKCDFYLGLQAAKGRITFDLSSLRIRLLPLRTPPVKPGFRCVYTDRVKKMPNLRGFMLNTDRVEEDDIRTLAKWGGRLARFQIGMNYRLRLDREGTAITLEEDIAKWRSHVAGNLDNLEEVLAWGRKYGVWTMIDMHVTPGARFKRNAPDLTDPEIADDGRMFHVKAYAEEYLRGWREIAKRFRGRDFVYGYDLVNEPCEKPGRGAKVTYWELQDAAIREIRKIDPVTPIVVSANWGDGPISFRSFVPFPYPDIIYQVHMYRPQSYTLQGWNMTIPVDPENRYPIPERGFNRSFLEKELAPVRKFEKLFGARIVCGEWSCVMWAPGCAEYLRDCGELFNAYGWDWAYGCLREARMWSLEHDFVTEPNGARRFVESADNDRRRAVLGALTAPDLPQSGARGN